MSKLPIINSGNNEGYNTMPRIQTPITSMNTESRKSSFNDYLINNQLNPYLNHNRLSPFAFEGKMHEFEAKMSALEESNKMLVRRLQETERDLGQKVESMKMKNDEERESRFRSDKAILALNDNNNFASSDIKNKIDFIQDLLQKEEKWKGEQRNRDLDLYKNLINKLTEKVSATVKHEVDARYKADAENKQLSQNINSRFEHEIDSIRKDLDDFIVSTKQEINQSTKECSNRSHNVSKYIDQQIANGIFGTNSNDNLKSFVMKLTEQVKTNLLSQSAQNEAIETRLKKVEELMPSMKDSFYEFIATVEERIVEKVKNIKVFTEINLRKSNEGIYRTIAELSKNTDDNIDYVKNQLISTRERIIMEFDKAEKDNKERFNVQCEDMTAMANRVYLYEDILKQHEDTYTGLKQKIEDEVKCMKIAIDVQAVNDKIMRTIENDQMKNDLKICVEAISSINNGISTSMVEMNKSSEINFMNLVDQINIHQEMIKTLDAKTLYMLDEFQKSFDRIETKQMMNEMVFRTEDEYIIKQLEKARLFEISTKNELNALYNNFNVSGDMMNKLKKENEEKQAKDGVNRALEQILWNVDAMAKDARDKEIANQNQYTLLTVLTDLDNRFQAHINDNLSEFQILKEIIDNMNKSNKSETEVKCTLNQVMNNAEFENIYKNLNILQTKLSTLVVAAPTKDYGEQGITNEVVDSKIAKALERIKQDNFNMWVNAVENTERLKDPEEIRKILKQVPPVIYPMNDSRRRIMDLNFDNKPNQHPYVPHLHDTLKKIDENQANMNPPIKGPNNPPYQPEYQYQSKTHPQKQEPSFDPQQPMYNPLQPMYNQQHPMNSQAQPSNNQPREYNPPKEIQPYYNPEQPYDNSQESQPNDDQQESQPNDDQQESQPNEEQPPTQQRPRRKKKKVKKNDPSNDIPEEPNEDQDQPNYDQPNNAQQQPTNEDEPLYTNGNPQPNNNIPKKKKKKKIKPASNKAPSDGMHTTELERRDSVN